MRSLPFAALALFLVAGRESAPRGETGGLTAVVAYDGPAPKPQLIEPFGEEGPTLDESLLVTPTGELANVIAIAETGSAPKWKCENVTVLIANNRAGPRIAFLSPGGTVEFKNAYAFPAKFISDFGAFEIPADKTCTRKIAGPGLDSPVRWYSG